MAILLTKGTKEYVAATVIDALGTLSSLTSPTYDVVKDDDSFLYTGAVGIASGLVINCMVDISASGPGGLIAEDTRLRLFVKFVNGVETIRLGPAIIKVVDEAI